ncbi:ATPase [Flavobacterium pedocola]
MYLLKKKISRKVKEFRENFQYIRFYNEPEPVILIGLNNRTKIRTYLNLIFRIRQQYEHPIVIEFSLFRYFLFAKWFKELDFIYFSKPFSKPKTFRVFSHSEKADFRVNYNYRKVYSKDEYVSEALPYIMHPRNYMHPEPVLLEKNIGILISGNFEAKIYDTTLIRDNFKMLNRWEIYSEIVKHPSLVQITGTELMEGLSSKVFSDKFVLMKWQNGAIPNDKWRHYLSASNFLFCAPGMTMPMCHNVVEAMSVGVIPIINYENWLNPSLEDKVNCLVYHDQKDIANVIDLALSMSEAEILHLRKNVVLYFESYYKAFDFEAKQTKELVLINEDIRDLV